jgi:hypothetical protein
LGDNRELGPLKRIIIERTEGNLFFIEEMLQALFDEGVLARNGMVKITRPFSQLRAIHRAGNPRRPHWSPAGRAQELLQTLAVIGRESRLDLIRQIVPTAEQRLHPDSPTACSILLNAQRIRPSYSLLMRSWGSTCTTKATWRLHMITSSELPRILIRHVSGI